MKFFYSKIIKISTISYIKIFVLKNICIKKCRIITYSYLYRIFFLNVVFLQTDLFKFSLKRYRLFTDSSFKLVSLPVHVPFPTFYVALSVTLIDHKS